MKTIYSHFSASMSDNVVVLKNDIVISYFDSESNAKQFLAKKGFSWFDITLGATGSYKIRKVNQLSTGICKLLVNVKRPIYEIPMSVHAAEFGYDAEVAALKPVRYVDSMMVTVIA